MKKGLKIGMLTMAFLAAMTAVISTVKVSAENSNNIVEVVIGEYNSGQNTCTGTDYLFRFTGSTADQDDTQTGSISCKFGKSSQQAVTLQLNTALALSGDSSVVIPSTGVLLTNGTWNVNPEVVRGTAPSALNESQFTAAVTVFNKAANTIGDAWSDEVAIKVNVPAGQPNGTYNGTLVLTYGG